MDRVDAVRQDEQMEGMYMSTELFEMELREKGREEGLKVGMEKGAETTMLANIRNLIETMQLSARDRLNCCRSRGKTRKKFAKPLAIPMRVCYSCNVGYGKLEEWGVHPAPF